MRYPGVELATGLLFAAVASWLLVAVVPRVPLAAAVLVAVAFLYLAAISIALALIDLDTHKLPNAIVLPAYGVGLVLLGGASIVASDGESIIRGVIGMAAMFIAYLVMALIYPGGMGFGDVKLAGVLGLFLGWLGLGPLFVGAFAAFFLGGIFALVLVLFRKAGRKTGIPFGPWMLVGAWVGVFAGKVVLDRYLALFGLGI